MLRSFRLANHRSFRDEHELLLMPSYEHSDSSRARFLELVRAADVGISDFVVEHPDDPCAAEENGMLEKKVTGIRPMMLIPTRVLKSSCSGERHWRESDFSRKGQGVSNY